jgi:hypothetical protein
MALRISLQSLQILLDSSRSERPCLCGYASSSSFGNLSNGMAVQVSHNSLSICAFRPLCDQILVISLTYGFSKGDKREVALIPPFIA